MQNYATQSLLKITELLKRLPRVVLLLLKTNDCLRAVDNALVCTFVCTHCQYITTLFWTLQILLTNFLAFIEVYQFLANSVIHKDLQY